MASIPTDDVEIDIPSFLRVYKDGRIERYPDFPYIAPTEDPNTGVQSKDVLISPETGLTVRLFLPKTQSPDEKLPIIIYIHGGAFAIESAFSSLYHPYVSNLAAESNAIVVSVEYRLAPEHPVPACYEDSWTAFKWVASHSNSRNEPEAWINDYADFSRVFLAGDSAGANIAHDTMVRAGGGDRVDGVNVEGMILVHSFFGDGKADKIWSLVAPEIRNLEDPRLRPMAHPDLLRRLACRRVLVLTASGDFLNNRSWSYHEALKTSGWPGELEIVETEGESHCFHLQKPGCEKAKDLMNLVADFIRKSRSP